MTKYLTIEEAANLLGVEYKTVYKLVRGGEIPAGKIGRVYRILDSDLKKYFENQKQALTGAGSGSRKCGVCGQPIVSELSIAGECVECGAPICPACWSVKKIRRCGSHGRAGNVGTASPDEPKTTSGAADQIAVLKSQGLQVVTLEEARDAEATYIREFIQRVGHLSVVEDRLNGLELSPESARTKHSEHHGNAGMVSRFVFRSGGWGKPMSGVIIEAMFVAHIVNLQKQGYDCDPVNMADMNAIFEDIMSRKGDKPFNDSFTVIQIASPTGFDREVVDYICSGRFMDKNIAVTLLDIGCREFILERSDQRLVSYWPVVAPSLWKEQLTAAVAGVDTLLKGRKSLALKDAKAELDLPAFMISTAFDKLMIEGYVVDNLKKIGKVISKPEA